MLPLRPGTAAAAAPVAAKSARAAAAESSRPAAPKSARDSAKRDASCDARTRRAWWLTPLAVLVIVAAFGYAYYPVARVQYRETRERARLEAEYNALRARNARLRDEVALLRTPEGVEDYARTQLGLVKRGEHVVIVRGASQAKAATARTGVPDVDSDYAVAEAVGPWTAFLDVVFGVQ